MLVLIFRSVVIYLLVLVIIRLMGKRQVGELQPFELVITLIIADLACVPMSEITVPLLHGVAPLITILMLHYLLTKLSQVSLKFRKLISGEAKLVMTPSGIDFNTLKALNLTIDDLEEAIRTAGYFDLEDVNYAIVETNGNINVIPKSSVSPVSNESLNIKTEENNLPLTLISCGKIERDNLILADLSMDFLTTQLKKLNINNIKEITYCNINQNGKMYVQPKNKKYIIHNTSYKGGGKW